MAGDKPDPQDWLPSEKPSHTLGSDSAWSSESGAEPQFTANQSQSVDDTVQPHGGSSGTLAGDHGIEAIDRAAPPLPGDRRGPPDAEKRIGSAPEEVGRTDRDEGNQRAAAAKILTTSTELPPGRRELSQTTNSGPTPSDDPPPHNPRVLQTDSCDSQTAQPEMSPVRVPHVDGTGSRTLLSRENCRALLAYPRGLSAEAEWPADISPGSTLDCDKFDAASADYGVQLESRETRRGSRRVLETRAFRKGGQGHLYRGRHFSLRREVAVKVTKEAVPGIEPLSPPSGEHRVPKTERQLKQDLVNARAAEAEVLITAMLQHPNIVPIHEVGFDPDGRMFYTSAFIEGNAWSDRILELSLDDNLDVFDKVCDALSYAHSKGIIHRDLKPANVMVGEHGAVYVVDWGMAFPKPTCVLSREVNPLPCVGTPDYMAPELWYNTELQSEATDVYLLGGILFEILTGKSPRASVRSPQGDWIADWKKQVAKNSIDLSPEVEQRAEEDGFTELLHVSLQAMKAEQHERFDSVAELQEAVLRFRRHRECVAMARRADGQLQSAREAQDSRLYSRAINLLDEALTIWDRDSAGRDLNSRAGEGAGNVRSSIARQSRQTRLEAARFEQRQRNFDYALSLLDGADPDHALLVHELTQESAQARDHQAAVRRLEERERVAHRRRLQITRVAVALALFASAAGGYSALLYQKGVELSGTITSKELLLTEQDKKLTDQKEELSQRTKTLALKEQEIQKKNWEVAAKNSEIDKKNKEINSKEIELTNKTAEVADAANKLLLATFERELAKVDRFQQRGQVVQALEALEDLSRNTEYQKFRRQNDLDSRRRSLKFELDQQQQADVSADTHQLFAVPRLGSLIAMQFSGAWQQLVSQSADLQAGPILAAVSSTVAKGETLVASAVSPTGHSIARLWRPRSSSAGQARIEVLDGSGQLQATLARTFEHSGESLEAPAGLLFLDEQTLVAAFAKSKPVAVGNATRYNISLEIELLEFGNSALTPLDRKTVGPLGRSSSVPSSEFLSQFFNPDSTRVVQDGNGNANSAVHWHVVPGAKGKGKSLVIIGNHPEMATTLIVDVIPEPANRRLEMRLLGMTTALHPKNPQDAQKRLPLLASAIDPRGKWGISVHKSLPNRILRWELDQLRSLVATNFTADDLGGLDVDDLVDEMNSSRVLLAGRLPPSQILTGLSRQRRAHRQPVTALQFSPDGTRLVSTGADSQLKHWDLEHSLPQLLESVPFTIEKSIDRLRFADPEGRHVVGDNEKLRRERSVTRFQLAQGPQAGRDEGDLARGKVLNFTLVQDGDSLAGRVAGIVMGADDVNGLIFSERLPDGSPGQLRQLPPINPFQTPPESWLGEGTLLSNLSVAIDEEGRFLAASCIDGVTRIWNLKERRQVAVLKRPSVGIDLSVALSSRANWAMVPGDRSAVAHLFQLRDGQPVGAPIILPGSSAKIAAASALAFSLDERWAATGDRYGTLRLWDLQVSPPKPVSVSLNPKARINAIGFSKDHLFVATDNGTVHEFDLQGKPQRVLSHRDFGSFVTQMAVSEDGLVATLVTTQPAVKKEKPERGDVPSKVVLWDTKVPVPQGRLLTKSESAVSDTAADSKVRFQQQFLSLSFARGSRRLVVLEPNTTVRVWDLPTPLPAVLTEAARLKGGAGLGGANAAVLSNQGTRLLTLHLQSVHQWGLDLEKSQFQNLAMHSSNIEVPSAAIDSTGRYVLTASPFSGIKGWEIQRDSIVGLGQMATEPPLGGYRLVRFQPLPQGQPVEILPFATVARPAGDAREVVQVHTFHVAAPQQRFQGTRTLDTGMPVVHELRYSPDGRWLVAWGEDAQEQATISIWSVRELDQPPRILRDAEVGKSFQYGAIDPDSRVVIGAAKNGKLAIWRLDSAETGPPIARGLQYEKEIVGVAAFLDRNQEDELARLRIMTLSQDTFARQFELNQDASRLDVKQESNLPGGIVKSVLSFQYVNAWGQLVILLEDGTLTKVPYGVPDPQVQRAEP